MKYKYIRTEGDKIIGYDENSSELDKPMILHYPNKIVKESDNIKELLDAYVYVKGRYKEVVNDPSFMPYEEGDYKFCDEIYGAIWTDKGLIYVAKLNDKGEWELL